MEEDSSKQCSGRKVQARGALLESHLAAAAVRFNIKLVLYLGLQEDFELHFSLFETGLRRVRVEAMPST